MHSFLKYGPHLRLASRLLLPFKQKQQLSSVISLTNRCNQRCIYCNYPFNKERELSLAEIKRAIDKLKESGVVRLGITGGEPFCRDELLEVAKYAKERKFFLSLNTNLTMVRGRTDVFEYFDLIFTSLDAIGPVNKLTRGVDSAEVLAQIELLKKRKKKVVVIFVMNERNIRKWFGVFKFCLSQGLLFSVQIQCTNSKITRGDLASEATRDMKTQLRRMLRLKMRYPRTFLNTFSYFEYLLKWRDFSVVASQADGFCRAGTAFSYIDCTGHVSPCAYVTGSVRADFLADQPAELKRICNSCIVGPYLQLNLILQKRFGKDLMVLLWSLCKSLVQFKVLRPHQRIADGF